MPDEYQCENPQSNTGKLNPAAHLKAYSPRLSQLHPWDESYLIMVDKLFDVLLQLACQYLIEDFCIYVHHGYWPEVFFSC